MTITLQIAKEISTAVLDGSTDSYVDAARALASFIVELQSVRPILQKDDSRLLGQQIRYGKCPDLATQCLACDRLGLHIEPFLIETATKEPLDSAPLDRRDCQCCYWANMSKRKLTQVGSECNCECHPDV